MTKLDPVAGYVVKTTTLVGERKKIFINVCVDAQVPAPEIMDIAEITTRVMANQDWVVPIIVSPEQTVNDKAGNPAKVYDCCMNPNVLYLSAQDPGIKVLVNETCIELVEDASGYDLDRNYAIPKMKSKGPLQKIDLSPQDFTKRPKPLEQMLSEHPVQRPVLAAKETPVQAPQKPIIELVGETVSNYSMNPYSRRWGGLDASPRLEVEVPGQHQCLKVDGQTIILGELNIPVEGPISKTEAVYTKDDDTLHIFIW